MGLQAGSLGARPPGLGTSAMVKLSMLSLTFELLSSGARY